MKLRIKVLGGMIPYPPEKARRVLYEEAHVNLGDLESYPELKRAWDKAITFSSLYSLGRPYPGIITSGATESNILAAYIARTYGARRVLFFETAHYSVVKAAKLLGLEPVKLPVINGFEPDLEALEENVRVNDFIVLTLGNTFTGYFDPVEEVAEIAKRVGAFIHVDAAFAGPLLQFIEPKPIRRLDAVVRTLALDLHKIVEAPIGVGVLLAYSEDYLGPTWFEAPYIPSGKQVGILGTRAGAPLLAAEVIIDELAKENKMKDLYERLMSAAKRVYEELVEKGPYDSPHEPQIPLVCLTHERLDKVLNKLALKGYRVYTCRPLLDGIRLAIMPHTLESLDEIISLLKSVAED
jgi:tyrosine decarboxylase/aspartate 1-decarboxylase